MAQEARPPSDRPAKTKPALREALSLFEPRPLSIWLEPVEVLVVFGLLLIAVQTAELFGIYRQLRQIRKFYGPSE